MISEIDNESIFMLPTLEIQKYANYNLLLIIYIQNVENSSETTTKEFLFSKIVILKVTVVQSISGKILQRNKNTAKQTSMKIIQNYLSSNNISLHFRLELSPHYISELCILYGISKHRCNPILSIDSFWPDKVLKRPMYMPSNKII